MWTDRAGRPLPDDILEALGLIPYDGNYRVNDRKTVPVRREPKDWFLPRAAWLGRPDKGQT